jgi:aminoglycoside phosphotransferase (APT) family kinase protein
MTAAPSANAAAAVAVRRALSRHLSAAGARLSAFADLPDGHAGLAFAAEVTEADGRETSLVVKASPPGVPRSGSTDILRQVPLLNRLQAEAFPVPRVIWSLDDVELGVAIIAMERLPGRTFVVWRPHSVFLAEPSRTQGLWFQAAECLARLHTLNAGALGWEAPTSLGRELDRWGGLLRHTVDDAVLRRATGLRDRLAASIPPDEAVGVVHGDFQPGNILFAQGRLTGVVDWDLASIGPQGVDVGWLLMMADAAAWPAEWRPVAPLSPDDLLRAYAAAGGPAVGYVAWHRAFAHFRMVAITGLNLKLHRSGRRVDEVWELFGRSARPLLARAEALLEAERPG